MQPDGLQPLARHERCGLHMIAGQSLIPSDNAQGPGNLARLVGGDTDKFLELVISGEAEGQPLGIIHRVLAIQQLLEP